jgi:hypothetical protein
MLFLFIAMDLNAYYSYSYQANKQYHWIQLNIMLVSKGARGEVPLYGIENC